VSDSQFQAMAPESFMDPPLPPTRFYRVFINLSWNNSIPGASPPRLQFARPRRTSRRRTDQMARPRSVAQADRLSIAPDGGTRSDGGAPALPLSLHQPHPGIGPERGLRSGAGLDRTIQLSIQGSAVRSSFSERRQRPDTRPSTALHHLHHPCAIHSNVSADTMSSPSVRQQ
jgi:hypothetical protein